MKTATVADLLRRRSARGRPGAKRAVLQKPDMLAQLREVWGDRVFTDDDVRAMREAELEGHAG